MVDVVERWIVQAGVRKDFLGCIDLVAVKPGEPILGVQATSADNVAARLNKARALPGLKAWLDAGAAFQVWGWALRKGRWHVRRVAVQPGELQPLELQALPKRRRVRKGERQRGLFAQQEIARVS
jgi:hypothetical protein